MKYIKRIVTTISAQFNDLVEQVENHQAITESALRKFRADIKEAKTQVRILEKELIGANKHKEKSAKEVQAWTERAKEYGKNDREKAIQCVKGLKIAEKEQELWQQRSQSIEQSLESLKNQIYNVEARYLELRTKQRDFESREASAGISAKASSAGGGLDEDSLEDLFNRWDKKLIRTEVEGESDFVTVDGLAQEIEQEQERLGLEATLDDLLSESKGQ